jgi:hypothetical protein
MYWIANNPSTETIKPAAIIEQLLALILSPLNPNIAASAAIPSITCAAA